MLSVRRAPCTCYSGMDTLGADDCVRCIIVCLPFAMTSSASSLLSTSYLCEVITDRLDFSFSFFSPSSLASLFHFYVLPLPRSRIVRTTISRPRRVELIGSLLSTRQLRAPPPLLGCREPLSSAPPQRRGAFRRPRPTPPLAVADSTMCGGSRQSRHRIDLRQRPLLAISHC